MVHILITLSTLCSTTAFKPVFNHLNTQRVNYLESSGLVNTAVEDPTILKDAPATMKMPKVGVLLLNLGGPENQDDVEGFLYNLFADPDIIRLPRFLSGMQKPLATVLSKRRAPQSREAYESIGGGSPIVRYTKDQASALAAELEQRGYQGAKCYVAMRYWYPFTEQALDEILDDDISVLVILPLYPQFSISTSGSSLRVLQEIFAKEENKWGPDRILHTVVPAFYDRPGYVNSIAQLIQHELDQYDNELDRHVLFSAHGVPQSYIEAGDPYQAHIEECVKLISNQLPPSVVVHLSYQSRVGPVEWLRPYTDTMLRHLGAEGVKNLVVVPISFVSEHIETLEEIDMEYRELAEESGISNWRRCPALNNNANFITDLASIVEEALDEPLLTVSSACTLNNCDLEMEPLEKRLGLERNLGITESAETLNGRVAMMGLFSTFLLELVSGKNVLHFFGG